MIHGWNNTSFNGDAAVLVAVLLLLGLGGPALGFIWRNTPPREALLMTGFLAAAIIVGCIWLTLD